MRYSAWVLAYHGCDKKVGEQILRGERELRVSSNSYDWLGTGAYFWENSFSRALNWARFLRANPKASSARVRVPFVIGAIIDPGSCLDLTDAESLDVLREAYEPFVRTFEAAGAPLPKNLAAHSADADLVKRKLDCAVINYLHDTRKKRDPFDTVRGPFLEGVPLFPGSRISSRSHIQWCVRSPGKSVLAYFRPRVSES